MPAASALTGFVIKTEESSLIIFGVMLVVFSEAAVVQDWYRPKIRRAVKRCFIVVISANMQRILAKKKQKLKDNKY